MDLWARGWSALSSAATLMVLTARRDGSPLSDAQRARIVWELEKYAPCYCEVEGAALLASAEPVAQRALENAANLNALGAIMVEHGTRVLRPRDRQTLRFVVAASVRTAAMSRKLDASDISVLHHTWTRSKGQMAIDGSFGSVELGSQDGMRAKQPDMLDALLQSPGTPLDMRRRMHELARHALLPMGWDAHRALAFLVCAPLALEGAAFTADQHAQLLGSLAGAILDRVPNETERGEARTFVDACSPRDPFVFLTLCEDQLAFFVDRPKSVQESVLRCINAVATGFGPVTANKHELVTLAMAVLAQGRSAAWRHRTSPPNAMFSSPRPRDLGGNLRVR
ncbi:MAG: hypothetical protein H6721_03985 [Sandaracinus sp.]|nr:hypothetical protein [Myxococcales bacterium]MCB9600707.1 hypothetical protein [Sandaracinus sp.]MCB9631284.1 hypothetical protein [Sandaracinus sp.]